VQRDVEDGTKLGINGTPTIFINGRRISAKGYDELKATIDTALKTSSPKTNTIAPKPVDR
jgi:protein-disulfide isomerase